MPSGRYSPDAFTLVDPSVHYSTMPIVVSGAAENKHGIYRTAQNQNQTHRLGHKVYVLQDFSSSASDDYIAATSTADPNTPDTAAVWYLDHLPAIGGLRTRINAIKTDGGECGIKFILKNGAGTTWTIHDIRIDTLGAWTSSLSTNTTIYSVVADTTEPHLLIMAFYQIDVGATLAIRSLSVMGEGPASTALPAGVAASGYIPHALEQWDANSPLCVANMQAAVDNLAALRADRNSTFLNWSEWLQEAGSMWLVATDQSGIYSRISKVPLRYMSDQDHVHYAVCAYAEDAGDNLYIYTANEQLLLGPPSAGGITAYHPIESSLTIDPTDMSHWHTGTIAVNQKKIVMGNDYAYVDFETPIGRDTGILGIAIWE